MKSDLNLRSRANIMFKYADNTNLLVSEITDIPISDEVFLHSTLGWI